MFFPGHLLASLTAHMAHAFSLPSLFLLPFPSLSPHPNSSLQQLPVKADFLVVFLVVVGVTYGRGRRRWKGQKG